MVFGNFWNFRTGNWGINRKGNQQSPHLGDTAGAWFLQNESESQTPGAGWAPHGHGGGVPDSLRGPAPQPPSLGPFQAVSDRERPGGGGTSGRCRANYCRAEITIEERIKDRGNLKFLTDLVFHTWEGKLRWGHLFTAKFSG